MNHLEQITGDFPLAIKQRNALNLLFKLKDRKILAVNRPPGTGKRLKLERL